jgi:hypothetical protein
MSKLTSTGAGRQSINQAKGEGGYLCMGARLAASTVRGDFSHESLAFQKPMQGILPRISQTLS